MSLLPDAGNAISENNGEPWAVIGRKFRRNATEGEQLDIYQMCAFLSYNINETHDIVDKYKNVKLYFYYAKAAICLLFQTVVLCIYIYVLVDRNKKPFKTCRWEFNDENWYTKIVALVACLYVSVNIGALMQTLDNQGLYQIDSTTFEDCPPYINRFWIYFGLYTNFVALFIALYGSFIVIFVSVDAVEIVLNCVAIFFVLDIDDLLADHYDYERIQKWFENEKDVAEKYKDNVALHIKSYEKCCAGCMGTSIGLFAIFSVAVAFVAPFVVFICY
eukprot:435646_1